MGDAPRVAILGATGHIGRALSAELAPRVNLALYARRPDVARAFGAMLASSPEAFDLADLDSHEHDALVCCIGEGDPAAVADPAVFGDVARYADDLVLGYLGRHPGTVLVNMSSGAAYCSDFSKPAAGGEHRDECLTGDAYARAKRASEARHRAAADAAIVDLRVFGFFSRYIDLGTSYFMADVVRALATGEPLVTGPSDFARDYVAPADLAALVMACMASPRNTAFDVYSAAPVSKSEVLEAFAARFGLTYSVVEGPDGAPGGKAAYYSLDRRAEELGYRPTRTSLETLEEETAALLEMMG